MAKWTSLICISTNVDKLAVGEQHDKPVLIFIHAKHSSGNTQSVKEMSSTLKKVFVKWLCSEMRRSEIVGHWNSILWIPCHLKLSMMVQCVLAKQWLSLMSDSQAYENTTAVFLSGLATVNCLGLGTGKQGDGLWNRMYSTWQRNARKQQKGKSVHSKAAKINLWHCLSGKVEGSWVGHEEDVCAREKQSNPVCYLQH